MFQGHEENAGQIGLDLVLAGIVGAIVAGIWLDKTKSFKLVFHVVIHCKVSYA
jgi:FLVCR family feline leukemia virus subgroup C receptor-related protein